MNQAKLSLIHRSCEPNPTAVILVMPGRLCRQADRHEFRASSPNVLDELSRTLSHFNGNVCGIILDSEILQIGRHPKLAASFSDLLSRAKSRPVIYADHIDERDRNCSALAIVQQMVSKGGLDSGRDAILLTGAGWDGTDRPTDLLGYAFRGLGFTVTLDPRVRLPRRPSGWQLRR
jgi:hypothetical protein